MASSIVKINDLGKFADLNAVWHSHPEGGREGDYLRIGNDEYMWDKYERDWKTTSSGSGDHTPEGGVVDGDLTVGGNLHVGGDADIEGTLTVGDIRIGNGDRFKGQSTYKSIVFKRANARPSKPAAWDGSFSNPVPSGGWSDGVPAGNTPIWMTSRIFTSDGNAPQENVWSDVVLMSDAESFDVEFSMAGTDTVPAAPTPNNLGYLWFDPVRDAGNANAHWDRMNWMATRSKSTDASGNAAWSDWTIVLIKGESVATVKTEPVMYTIDTDNDGKLSSAKIVTVKAWLYYGDTKEIPILSMCSASYNGRDVNIDSRQSISQSDPYITISFALSVNAELTTKDLTIRLANSQHSATTTVPIVINRQGATGQSVFRSTVFRFYEPTQANPAPPAPTGGDYFHPADVNESSVWSDGIPATGSGPLWMSHRLFTSDGQEPQESTWSTPILAQDIDNSMDVEYSPNDLDDIPGVPDGTNQEGSGQIWFDRKRDASNPNADWSAMNWMAIRIREVNANGYPEWGSWVITQIRGEKGDDGAGQAYVATSIDQVVVDCGADGRPKAAVDKTITARLMWGDEECTLLRTRCSVTEDTAGSVSTQYYPIGNVPKKYAEVNYTVSAGIEPQLPVLASGLITITLVGTDSNSVEHVATKTVPIYANQQGETGNSGPVLRFRGAWSGSENYTYNDIFRDCVKYNGIYWVLSDRHDGTTSAPNADGTWTSIGNMNFVATDLLLSEQATIHNLIADRVKTAPTGARVEMYGNKAEFYGTLSFPSIELFVDNEGVGCLRFYDVNHNAVIEIGPRGMNWLMTLVEAKFSSAYYVKMTGNTPDKSDSTAGQVQLHQFTARRANGVITGSSQTGDSADIAAQADGKYFTSTPIYSNGALNNNLLANGLYRSSSARIFQYQPSIGKYTDIDEMKSEFMANYGLTETQANIFTWSLDNSPIPKLATPINILAFLKFVAGVPYTVLHFWQGSNNDLVIGLD